MIINEVYYFEYHIYPDWIFYVKNIYLRDDYYWHVKNPRSIWNRSNQYDS